MATDLLNSDSRYNIDADIYAVKYGFLKTNSIVAPLELQSNIFFYYLGNYRIPAI